MKKRIFLAILMSVLLIGILKGVCAASGGMSQRGNHRTSIDAAQAVASINGVKEAAVLSLDGYVIAGISVFEDADAEKIFVDAEEVIKKVFPKEKDYRIEAGSPWADKVIELSFYLETNMSPRVLKKRFRYLVTENKEI